MTNESDKIKLGDAVDFRGERWIAVWCSREGWWFQPAKKDGTAHKNRSLQRLNGYKKINPENKENS